MSTHEPSLYKRSQVEHALVSIERVGGTPDRATRANLKRLLDLDRKPRAEKRSWAHEHFAFYDEAAPGHGAEIAYRAYHAFALLVGLRLLKGGVTQSYALKVLRDLRPALEPAFVRVTAQPAWALRPDLTEAARATRVRDGYLLGSPDGMAFLVVRAGTSADFPIGPDPDDPGLETTEICLFAELAQQLVYFSHMGQAAVVLELVNAAYQLLDILPRMQARRRGRP